MNYPLIKAYVAEGATSQFLIAKQGTGDNQILKADAAAAGEKTAAGFHRRSRGGGREDPLYPQRKYGTGGQPVPDL